MTGPGRAPRRPRDTTILVALAAGHVAVAAGVVALAVLLVLFRLAELDLPRIPGTHRYTAVQAPFFAIALVALVIGQFLSVRRLHAHRAALVAGGPDDEALASGARRLGWPLLLGMYPAILGPAELLIDPAPAGLLALTAAVALGSLLLDHAHAGWIDGRAATSPDAHHALLAGSGRRLRSRQRMSVAVAVLLTAIAAGALVAECVDLSGGRVEPVTVLHALAALSVVLLGSALLRPAVLVRVAVHDDDTVDRGRLRATAMQLRRTAPVASVAAALTVAAILARPDVALLGVVLPLVVLVGSDALQLASVTSVTLNDAVILGYRRRRLTRS